MSTFKPENLSVSRNSNQAERSERLFVVVEKYETPADGYHYAVGHKANNPAEKVKVRLNTVEERSKDFPKIDVDKIKDQYFSGQTHRDTIADKAKAGVVFLSFDDARKLENSGDGVVEYRAHWPKTMSTKPDAEVITGLATIVLKENNTASKKASASINFIKNITEVNKDNYEPVLLDALAIKDKDGNARNPYVTFRSFYKDELVAVTNLYPATETTPVFDQNSGQYKDIKMKVDAVDTLIQIQKAVPSGDDLLDGYRDRARAIISGLLGEDEPVFNSKDDKAVESAKQYYYGTKQGELKVEVVENESIYFGTDSRKTYLNDKDKFHLSVYDEADENDVNKKHQVYTDTVVAVHRYPDGEPFAVYAAPVKMYPTMEKLSDIKPSSIKNEASVSQEASGGAENNRYREGERSTSMPQEKIVETEEESELALP